jgi:hypothetical protein
MPTEYQWNSAKARAFNTDRIIEALNGTIRELTALYRVQLEAESTTVDIGEGGEKWPSEETEEKIAKIYTRIMALSEVGK